MAEEQALFTLPDGETSVPVERVSGTDGFFRARLEANVDAGYRLSAVILGDPREAEDVTHDALERAWRARSTLRDAERFEVWFQRIVVNACRDRMRRRKSVPLLVSMESAGGVGLREVLTGHVPDPTAATAERDALGRALEQLTEDEQVVIALRYYLDLEVDEIARRLGARSGTVKSRLHRGLKHLRAAWDAAERREVEPDR